MPTSVIQVEEESDAFIETTLFDETIALNIYNRYKDKLDIQFPSPIQKDNYKLRSKGYIGQIPLSESVLLVINPKISISNVFGMLEYAYNLRSFHILDGTAQVGSINEMFEKLASILARRVLDRARKGLYRDYILEEGALKHLKGRCLLMKSWNASMRGSTRLECEYEDNTADLEENRILAWTLYRMPRISIKNDKIKREVKQAYRALASAVSVISVAPEACIGRLYNRLNEDYKQLHGLCRFFLEQCGPTVTDGEKDFVPFLLDMPTLFESFVARWLKLNAPENLKVDIQYSIHPEENKLFRFVMDIVLRDAETDKVLAILDTKYKRPKTPSNDDIFQVVTYALQLGTERAFLVYPSSNTELVNVNIGADEKVQVQSIIFDIGDDIESAGRRFLMDLQERVASIQ